MPPTSPHGSTRQSMSIRRRSLSSRSQARIGNIEPAAVVPILEQFLAEAGTITMAIDVELGQAAIDAFERFGKGRHPAALNLGDCFAYACAQRLSVPLLCKGNDFPLTDAIIA